MIKNVIFDCGNVLLEWNPKHFISFYIDNANDVEIIYNAAFVAEYWEKNNDYGLKSLEEYWQDCCIRLPERLHTLMREILMTLFVRLPEIPGMFEAVEKLQNAGYKVYLLSNFTHEIIPQIPQIRILNRLDGIVISGPLHIVKPDIRIYEHLIEKFSLNPETCLFVDDRQTNLDGAAKCGIQGYLFDGDADKFLKSINL